MVQYLWCIWNKKPGTWPQGSLEWIFACQAALELEKCVVKRGGPRDAKAVVTDVGEGCAGQRHMTSLTLSYDRTSVIFWIGPSPKIFIVCAVPRIHGVHVGVCGLYHNQEPAGVGSPCWSPCPVLMPGVHVVALCCCWLPYWCLWFATSRGMLMIVAHAATWGHVGVNGPAVTKGYVDARSLSYQSATWKRVDVCSLYYIAVPKAEGNGGVGGPSCGTVPCWHP